jgi:hypothetical protein
MATPARGVSFAGRETIKSSHPRVFGSAEEIMFQPIERFATPNCVRDDMWETFRISGDGFENCPFPIGTMVKMRLLHNFHIRDRLIYKKSITKSGGEMGSAFVGMVALSVLRLGSAP